nr:MAG TPA: hypothetical protein [Caudoviricetes sp.]
MTIWFSSVSRRKPSRIFSSVRFIFRSFRGAPMCFWAHIQV